MSKQGSSGSANAEVFKEAHDKPPASAGGDGDAMPKSTRRDSQTDHQAHAPPVNSNHEVRWRAAWAGEKSKGELWIAEPINTKKRLAEDDIAGSRDYKVAHHSQYLEDRDIEWYKSPQFRYTPTSNSEFIYADIVKKDSGREVVMRQFLRSGPRKEIFFNPKHVRAAIATCGGLCPGLNSVIRELVLCLNYTYGVRDVYGIPYGYEGFYKHEWKTLTTESVSMIHHQGGTVLGTSRGGFDKEKIINSLLQHNINHVFLIGGDGTHRGALALHEEIQRRKLKITVVGIPKTIDNDINLIDKSFGFDTAVEEANKAINSVHVETKSCINGIGIVVLMGRASGFIAMHATLASGEANICLIPEVHFEMDGPNGLLESLKSRMLAKGHAVLVVAEGAGADLLAPPPGQEVARDKSGNPRLPDIGSFLKQKIKAFFDEHGIEYNLKYIDPSYMIRSVPANSSDSVYTTLLAQNACYGAMAGFTGFTTALVNTNFCYVPIKAVCSTRKVDVNSDMWQRVMEITGQPDFLGDNKDNTTTQK